MDWAGELSKKAKNGQEDSSIKTDPREYKETHPTLELNTCAYYKQMKHYGRGYLEETIFTLLPCPVKSRPTSGDSHDRLPPGVPISS